jgi:hypothetical protein
VSQNGVRIFKVAHDTARNARLIRAKLREVLKVCGVKSELGRRIGALREWEQVQDD